MPESLLLALVLLCSAVGMGWLALAMETHWTQVHPSAVPGASRSRMLRVRGSIALLLSFGLCLLADHPSIAAVVWIMTLALSALLIALTLAWRPRLLRVLPVGALRAGAP